LRMEREQNRERIREAGIIVILRARDSEGLAEAVEAILAGGLGVIEVTMNTPGALETIARVRRQFGDRVLFGAGTVLDPETAREAILAGADFIVAPVLNPGTIEVCRSRSKVVIPGCFTPTEILTAWRLGADFVKVFPAEIGGPAYIRSVLAPLPQVALVPTGGVTVETIGAYFRAGAAAVALGSSLVSQEILDRRDFSQLTERSLRFREEAARARHV